MVCPHCKKTRYIRSTLLNDTNQNKVKSTLCGTCNKKTIQIFKKNNEGIWYTKINDKILYVDEEDIPKLQYANLQLMFYNQSIYQYVGIRINQKQVIPIHRYLLNITNPNIVVDHINHNTLDNRKSNLRPATKSDNSINSKIPTTNNTGFKNISLCNRANQKWFTQFHYEGKKVTKRFSDFLQAYAYLRDSKIYNNEYIYHVLNDKNIKYRYAGIDKDEIVNGEYVGLTIYTQFCSHHCKNCHNKSTWSADGGMEFSESVLNDIIEYFKKCPYAKRLTISGGDPIDNIGLTNIIASEFKYNYPDKELWIYTGYSIEQILNNIKYKPILELCDYIVDGEYIDEQRDVTLKFRGSKNQRVIDVQKSLEQGKVVLYCD